jgi:predicted dinucleotide-binding enzyme
LENKQLAILECNSGSETIAQLAPGARVVNAFNTIYYEHFERPIIESTSISMFYCGDDQDAKSIVGRLGTNLGLDVVDSGPLSNARLFEAMGFLWIFMALGCGYGLDIGYRLLRE